MSSIFNNGLFQVLEPRYKDIKGKPSIVITDKGTTNKLSNIANDGADFGPDTTQGATSPSQIGAPYSVTGGLQELFNYVATLEPIYPNNTVIGHKILIKGFIQVHADITLKYNNPEIKDSTACAGFSPFGEALLFDSRIRFENSIVEGKLSSIIPLVLLRKFIPDVNNDSPSMA